MDIDHGIVDLHVTFNGEDVIDAPVYLFTASGSYLGRHENTDAYGHAEFLIPAQSYKFRVDYDGTQYWSNVVNVIAHEETDVELPLEQLALNLTNDPNPVRFDGRPPIFEPEGIKVASIGSLVGILSQSIIANTSPPRVYYYLNDHLGTPQIMTDENNVVVWEAKYRPFGEADVHPYSNVENNIRFPGQYYDQETGLHYNYHRYYDPTIGRYLRPDPIGQIGGTNLFTYAQNNPVVNVDQLGLYVGAVGIGGSGALAGLLTPGFSGSASALFVNDNKGNWGIVVCACGGIASGTGFVAGLQTSHLWGVASVCDLAKGGFSLGFGAGGGIGPGMAADVSGSGLNVITGVGYGGWGGALSVIGGCKLIYSHKQCEENPCEDE